METNRAEAFSDGVFAIAITLLILAVGIEQALSEGSLGQQLVDLWPAYVAYAVSFLTIGIMWVNHHAVFRQFARVDRPLLLLNVLPADAERVHTVSDARRRRPRSVARRPAGRGAAV